MRKTFKHGASFANEYRHLAQHALPGAATTTRDRNVMPIEAFDVASGGTISIVL